MTRCSLRALKQALSFGLAALSLAVFGGTSPAHAAADTPLRADNVIGTTILQIYRPDLVINGWDVGKMWNGGSTVPIFLVKVKNQGNGSSPVTKTRVAMIFPGTPQLPGAAIAFVVDTPALAPGQVVTLAVPSSESLCGTCLTLTADVNNDAFEWNEGNNSLAFCIDCIKP